MSLRTGVTGALIFILLTLAGCAQAPVQRPVSTVIIPTAKQAAATEPPAPLPTLTAVPPTPDLAVSQAATDVPAATATDPAPQDTATLEPDAWQSLPVVPELSEKARQIYARGRELGTDPHAFSKVGDCESRTTWFLGDFDAKPKNYDLGPYPTLQDTVDYFAGSWGRLSLVARPGFTVASFLSPIWADLKICNKGESPLACEYRLHNPSIALISVGTNDVARPDAFEQNLRKVIEFTISQGIVPVLSTKADNLEGNNRMNATIARLAHEYDIPLWNFYLAAHELPKHGLQNDLAHLTWAPNDFSVDANLQEAWPVRNLTALQVMDALRKALNP